MPRIFIPSGIAAGSQVTITGQKAHYLSSVIRCSAGDRIDITDDSGRSFRAQILAITRKEVTAGIMEELSLHAESGLDLILLQGLLKGEKMDLIIQKATELGAKQIIPVITERSQIRETRRLPRWRKIAEEASKQSGRHVIPQVSSPADLDALFQVEETISPGIIFWEECGLPLPDALEKCRGAGKIALFTGPEGGFSSGEIDTALRHGFSAASLGVRIMRAETAAIAAVSITQYVLGDLGKGTAPAD